MQKTEMWKCISILLVIFVAGVAQADYMYVEDLAIGGGPTDADGGMTLDHDGDLTISGTIAGPDNLSLDWGVSDKLILGANSLAIVPTDGFPPALLKGRHFIIEGVNNISEPYTTIRPSDYAPSSNASAYLGTSSSPFDVAYISIINTQYLSASSGLQLDSDLYLWSVPNSNIVFKTESPSPTYAQYSVAGIHVDGTAESGADMYFYISPSDADDGEYDPDVDDPVLQLSDDSITANYVINAEGGIKIGGSWAIDPTTYSNIAYTNVAETIAAQWDFSAYPLVDADIDPGLTIDSTGDLSSPPDIGSSVPADGYFTEVFTDELTGTTDVFDIRTDDPLDVGDIEYRIAHGVDTTLTGLTTTLYNNTTPTIVFDHLTGDITTDGTISFGALSLPTLSIEDDPADGYIKLYGNASTAGQIFQGYADSNYLNFKRANGDGTAKTIVADNDLIFSVGASGYDGTDFENAAAIRAKINGTPGANDMPGEIVFLTTPDGSTTLTEAMTIGQDQSVNTTGALNVAGLASLDSGIDVDGAFTVTDATGAIMTSGATTLNGGLTMDTDKFVVADTTGNTTIGGTLDVFGATDVDAALSATVITSDADLVSGDDVILKDDIIFPDTSTLDFIAGGNLMLRITDAGTAGALEVTDALSAAGLASLDGGIDVDGTLTVDGSTGVLTTSALVNLDGGFKIDTNKLVVSDAGVITSSAGITALGAVLGTSGNFIVAADGSLTTSAAVNLNGGLTMDTDKFTVADTTGNTTIGGTLTLSDALVLELGGSETAAVYGDDIVVRKVDGTGEDIGISLLTDSGSDAYGYLIFGSGTTENNSWVRAKDTYMDLRVNSTAWLSSTNTLTNLKLNTRIDDGKDFSFGSNDDIKIQYDEAGDNRVEIRNSSDTLLGHLTTAGTLTMEDLASTDDLTVGDDLTVNGRAVVTTRSFSSGDSTPDVSGGNVFFTSGQMDSITGFDGGTTGQIITIIGVTSPYSTTISESGGSIELTSATLLLAYQDTAQLVYDGTSWLQLSYSDN